MYIFGEQLDPWQISGWALGFCTEVQVAAPGFESPGRLEIFGLSMSNSLYLVRSGGWGAGLGRSEVGTVKWGTRGGLGFAL